MINSNFTSYLQLLWQSHIRQAVPWARDNLVWGILVLLLPPITALSIFKRKIDWPPLWASVAFYAVALCIYVGVYFVRAAWKMDVQRQLEIRNQTLAFEQIVRGKDEEYRSVVRMKDGEFAAAMGEKAAEIEQLKRSVGYNDWKELADRFKSIDPHVEVQCQQTGEDHVARYRWEIRGRTLAESNECIVLCSL